MYARTKVPPVRRCGYSPYNITSGQYGVTSPPVQLRYHLPYVMYRDYADYKNQVWLYAVSNELPADLAAFAQWNFIWPLYGQYEMQLEYYLPGMSTPNSTAAYSVPSAEQQLNQWAVSG